MAPVTESSAARTRRPLWLHRSGPWNYLGLVPPAVAVLFAARAGNLAGGASATGALAATVSLLLVSLLLALSPGEIGRFVDPFRLGRGWVLPWALWLSALLAMALSPVPRAGRVAVVLAPYVAFLATATGSWWRSRNAGRWGGLLLSLGVAGVAVWGILAWQQGLSPRVSLPLGHHNLLAAWLVALVPVVLAPILERGTRHGGASRWLRWGHGLAGAVGAFAIVASGSLSGTLALGTALAVLAVIWLRHTRVQEHSTRGQRAVGCAVVILGTMVVTFTVFPRMGQILRGEDASTAVRTVYLQAGLDGIAARPVVGHGPGSTGWTLSRYLEPVPGVSPPGEVVGELHLLPLTLGYELGLVGLALFVATGVSFVRCRWRELGQFDAPGLSRRRALAAGGLAGLVGLAMAGVGTGDWRISALAVAGAVASGAALAGSGPREDDPDAPDTPPAVPEPRGQQRAVFLAVGLGCLALVALYRPHAAHREHDAAYGAWHTGDRAGAVAALERAHRLDPAFPLYTFQLARLGVGGEATAELAWRAAEDAGAVGSFWLAAAETEDLEASLTALRCAAALDPLLPFAPFRLALADPDADDAPLWAARALAAAPELGAAHAWESRPELLAAALEVLAREDRIDAGWRERYLAAMGDVVDRRRVGDRASRSIDLTLTVDRSRVGSLSKDQFRRQPWPVTLSPLPMDVEAARALDERFPPATTLPETDGSFFVAPPSPPSCPQTLWKTVWITPWTKG